LTKSVNKLLMLLIQFIEISDLACWSKYMKCVFVMYCQNVALITKSKSIYP
jgi:hypothetical protein